ncbi:oxidoreductase, short chain dehydrogenase/reductase family protein [Opisthorchis viverrini]|uniref:Oxidoreductase, short chain dehydrogenase/reductase family protein n=1 Tax=Opisthorchis viverrini TaxID=6198 RepID=A0A1S8X0A2_OPIVI|nr:oxidoreductase, short chain dehydrogenase/reductase family protein [Opisthorchis viverrini]
MLFMFTIAKKFYSKRKQLKNAGEWAIVTGAAAGIGQAYARELAKDGLNIMFIDIDVAGLSSMATELADNFSVKAITFVCDFIPVTSMQCFQRVACPCGLAEDLVYFLDPLSCGRNLLSSQGAWSQALCTQTVQTFDSFRIYTELGKFNVHSMIILTHIVLPRLLKQNKPGSAIINLKSFTGIIPCPGLSLYGASKALIKHFVKSLIPDIKDSDVIIQAVCPLVVFNSPVRDWRPSFFIPTPNEYVRSAIDVLGVGEITIG